MEIMMGHKRNTIIRDKDSWEIFFSFEVWTEEGGRVGDSQTQGKLGRAEASKLLKS